MSNANYTKKSIGISFATQYVELTIHFLSVLILARILSPDDIGTYSVAAFLMMLLHVFRDFGVVQYIIQEHDLTREKIRSAMGVAILLALGVALILLVCSGMIARFYANPAIEKILIVMSASFAISPFGSLLIGIFRRENKLKTIFYVKTASAICHVTVAVTLALWGFGAMSLAWANFAGILSFGIVASAMRPNDMPWLPQFRNIKTILSYGGITSLGNAANIAGTNIPDLVIGKMMSMAAVGYFSRATGLVQLFTRLISGALVSLVLPYFAQLRREGKDLAKHYVTTVEQLTALAWPFFAALALLAYPMIRALYGPQWDQSVPVVRLLCVAGSIASISLFATEVMVASGQVRNSTYSYLVAQPFRIAIVFFCANYGLLAIAAGMIASECITLVIVSWYLHRTIKVGLIALLFACRKSALIAVCSAIVPLLVKVFWSGDPSRPWLPLLIGIGGAGIGWIGAILITRHPLATHFISLLQSQRFAPRAGLPANDDAAGLNTLLKIVAYRFGALGTYHLIRNRKRLTVAMFHRVLPAIDARRMGADPEWTMTPESFSHCLDFFRRHYNIVTPDQVFSALRGDIKLPARSMLVTFDDGWADTAEFAQPVLDRHAIQALIFVVGSAIDRLTPFWEEAVFAILSAHPQGHALLEAALLQHGVQLTPVLPSDMTEKNVRTIIRQLGVVDREILDAVTHSLAQHGNSKAAMLDRAQLTGIAAAGHTIGGHGMTHQPLTKVANIETEMQNAQQSVSGYLNQGPILSMSFPHGAYSDSVIAQCRTNGYQYLFSSDACLNALGGNSAMHRPVGRIHISEDWITDRADQFQPSLLATWLFLRPVVQLNPSVEVCNG